MRYRLSDEPLGPDAPGNTVHLRAERDVLQLTLYCPEGDLVTGVDVSVEAGDWKRTVTTNGEGVLEVSLPAPRPPAITLRWTHDGAARKKTYYLEVGHFDSRDGRRRRFSNLFFAHGGLRKHLEDELATHEDEEDEDNELGGLDAYREAMRRMIGLLDETETEAP